MAREGLLRDDDRLRVVPVRPADEERCDHARSPTIRLRAKICLFHSAIARALPARSVPGKSFLWLIDRNGGLRSSVGRRGSSPGPGCGMSPEAETVARLP